MANTSEPTKILHPDAPTKDFKKLFLSQAPKDDIAAIPKALLDQEIDQLWLLLNSRKPGQHSLAAMHHATRRETSLLISNDDMPFLVDSLTAELNRQGFTVALVIHPVLRVLHTAKGNIAGIWSYKDKTADRESKAESVMLIRLPHSLNDSEQQALLNSLSAVLMDVRHAVNDWQPMRRQVQDMLDQYRRTALKLDKNACSETCAYLEWLVQNNFTFLGSRDLLFTNGKDGVSLQTVEKSCLGVLRDVDRLIFNGVRALHLLPQDLKDFHHDNSLIHFSKANAQSTVHRAVPMDVISLKLFDETGKLIGERRLVGLYTSHAYFTSPRHIPILRQKVAAVIDNAGFEPRSHDGKALSHILETFPRDELYQITADDLLRIALGILNLQERQRVALFTRDDLYKRSVSCFVYIPRDRYNLGLRRKIQHILEEALNGKARSTLAVVEESTLARLFFVIEAVDGLIKPYDAASIEATLIKASRLWVDDVRILLETDDTITDAATLYNSYSNAFPAAYQERFDAAVAVKDMIILEQLFAGEGLQLSLAQAPAEDHEGLTLKIFALGDALPLYSVLPVLENLGLRVINERPYRMLVGSKAQPAWIHEFYVQLKNHVPQDLPRLAPLFSEAFLAIWSERAENDALNGLVTNALLGWRDIVILRTLNKYLKQMGFIYGEAAVADTLNQQQNLAKLLIQLFNARFNPAVPQGARSKTLQALHKEFDQAMQQVSSVADDKILSTLCNLIDASLRTNFYQPASSGAPKDYVSIKFDSRAIDGLPLPRPKFEIFVYAPFVEAIHLRGGKVARGGIRWSDRREDFRQEVLGLLKAQMVKNAVIVPEGSKGGFVVKTPISHLPRSEQMQEVVRCYQTLMRGMLDITDNLVKGDVVPPVHVIRHDGDDPYLVVAADKGTATFSDIANGISQEYGFWLGDAFASGGSAGYDHKKMGITARGGWEAVKRHFRELGKDIQREDFTVVGVGDMSGDVFGNGMLLSKHIRLLAAFNHRHIFVDPTPNAAKSWLERERLFNNPGLQWSDYDSATLSKGGAVFERDQKTLQVSPEVQQLFGLKDSKTTPAALIQAILKHQADLLWFGGIGTYVRAGHETNLDVGDKANDSLRIMATELRCRVIGEGANLGMTQQARIEAGLRGVKLNTDAIDNSAGVDCSDHEVNIKILLQQITETGQLTLAARNKLLSQMTDEVAELVLKDNYLQTQALSFAMYRGTSILHPQWNLIRHLEKTGQLQRDIEFLPDDETIEKRFQTGAGLTRPELAVLMAYSKIDLINELMHTSLADEPRMLESLRIYFPSALQQKYADHIDRHPLRREIIITHTANSIVNRLGSHFVNEVRQATGNDVADIARAYAIIRDSFSLRTTWRAIENLDSKVSAETQLQMLLTINRLVEYCTYWFLRYGQMPLQVTQLAALYQPAINELRRKLPKILTAPQLKAMTEAAAELEGKGVPAELAQTVAASRRLAMACDVVFVAEQTGAAIEQAGIVYFALADLLHGDWLRSQARGLKINSSWQQKAVDALLSDLYDMQRAIAVKVLRTPQARGKSAHDAMAKWQAEYAGQLQGLHSLIADLGSQQDLDLSMLLVAARMLKGLA